MVIAGRKGMPCPHTTGVRIRPRLSATCPPDAAATVPSIGSLALSGEPVARGDSAVPFRGHPPTMSKFASTEINRLLLFSCSEAAPSSFCVVRVLVVPAAPSPVEVGPSASSPGTETIAMEFPSVSAPVETCITDAPNPSLALLPCRPPSRSELQVVAQTLPSVCDPPAGAIS